MCDLKYPENVPYIRIIDVVFLACYGANNGIRILAGNRIKVDTSLKILYM